MKILMIMYGKSVGGAELQFIELARELSKRHEVRMISLGGDGAFCGEELSENMELKVYPYSGKIAAFMGLFMALCANMLYRPKAIITTAFSGDFLGYVLGFFGRVQLVSLQTVSKSIRFPVIDRFILRRFDNLIAGSSDIRNYLIQHCQSMERIAVVNNWVDFSSREVTSSVAVTKEQYGIKESSTVVGCIGRLHHQKGQEYLIQAFRSLREDYPNLQLVLVGDGPNKAMLKGMVHDIEDVVIFTGSVIGADYNNLLNVFDVYVQPSRFEGMPRTLLDAMYLRKPIVATAVNGNIDAIRNGENGLLVPAGDSNGIAVAIKDLLNQPQYASELASQAHQDALDSFDMDSQLLRIESFLK